MVRLDAANVKAAASGRWPEILSNVAGIPASLLDGKGHPCPKLGCGGKDRFSFIDAADGAVHCRHCFSKNCGDGFAAVAWMLGCDFPASINLVADYLGLSAPANGAAKQLNGKPPGKTFATAADAVAEWERMLGPHSAQWTYHNADGEPVGVIVRWDLAKGDKEIKPASRIGDRWYLRGMPEPRPLYGLPDLADADVVYVVEGEKAADAARSIGLVATTSAHGAGSAHKTDWSPLAGKEVVKLPDNDAKGEEYRADVVGIVAKLTPPAAVKVVELPGLPEHGDIVDWIAVHGEACEPAEYRRQIEALTVAVATHSIDALADSSKESATVAATDERPARDRFTIATMTSAEFDGGDYTTDWLAENFMVANEPMVIAAGLKTMKTMLAVCIALSLALGETLFGMFRVPRPVRVLLFSGESGWGTLQSAARRMAASMGYTLADAANLIWSKSLPTIGQLEHMDELRRVIQGLAIKVIILDPLYFCLPGQDAGNLMIMGERLRSLSKVCEELGVTLVVVHHVKGSATTAKPHEPAELVDISWAGTGEWARQWVLLRRRAPYKVGSGVHELLMSVGGSAGHSSLWVAYINEGHGAERTWHVELRRPEDVRQAAANDRKGAKDEAHRERLDREVAALLRAARNCPNGETKTALRDRAGLNSGGVNKALTIALGRGDLVPCDVFKSGKKSPIKGYKLAPEPAQA